MRNWKKMKDKKDLPDFTRVYKKIFMLARNVRKLRRAFPHSLSDGRAEMDRKFIEEWNNIAKHGCEKIP